MVAPCAMVGNFVSDGRRFAPGLWQLKKNGKTKMRDYKKLDVWKIAVDLSKLVYEITGGFPDDEKYGLTSQIRRASVSISSNIAEGCGRRTSRDFVQFLHNASGSLKEVGSQLVLVKDLKYVSDDDFNKLNSVVIKLGNKLLSFTKYIEYGAS